MRSLRFLGIVAALLCGSVVEGHDFERTQVTLTFARDGSFVLDVANDAAWLEHRLIPFRTADTHAASSFADRVVLFVDGHEIRPASVERVDAPPPMTLYRMRGRVPVAAQSLRWYYGLPIDPYPLTIRRAGGRITIEEIAGDAWSRPIDLSGQFAAPRISATTVSGAIAAVLLVPLVLRAGFRARAVRRSAKALAERPPVA